MYVRREALSQQEGPSLDASVPGRSFLAFNGSYKLFGWLYVGELGAHDADWCAAQPQGAAGPLLIQRLQLLLRLHLMSQRPLLNYFSTPWFSSRLKQSSNEVRVRNA